MASEWVGTVATGIVGLAGIAATLWTQRQGRANTLSVARENRTQDRKRAAYERLLTLAIHTTEFVGGADVIWDRHAEPPDVDYKSFDAWLALDLYASPPFRTAYSAWSTAVEHLRDLLEDLPDKKTWYEAGDETQQKFLKGKKTMNTELQRLKDVARSELS